MQIAGIDFMRKYVLVIGFILAVQFSTAQVMQDDVVYLNNGTFLRGRIVELVPGKSLKLSLAKGK